MPNTPTAASRRLESIASSIATSPLLQPAACAAATAMHMATTPSLQFSVSYPPTVGGGAPLDGRLVLVIAPAGSGSEPRAQVYTLVLFTAFHGPFAAFKCSAFQHVSSMPRRSIPMGWTPHRPSGSTWRAGKTVPFDRASTAGTASKTSPFIAG